MPLLVGLGIAAGMLLATTAWLAFETLRGWPM